MIYADLEYYVRTFGGSIIPAGDVEKALRKASQTIDILTFNRINIDELTPFQLGIIKDCVCALAEWQTENSDILESPIDSYAINGASVSWDSSKGIKTVQGVLIPTAIYSRLQSSGLCFRGGIG